MEAVTATPSAARANRFLLSPLRFLFAVVAAQNVLGSILLLGYLYQTMRVEAVSVLSGRARGPVNWLAAAEPGQRGMRRWTDSLTGHVRTGIQATFGLALLALPPGALMAFSWYAGWNNSFNKGYEFAAVGPLAGIAGVILATITLAWLPIAQARNAATGDWRCLVAWRTNLTLMRATIVRALPLAVAGTIFALLLLFTRGFLAFAPQIPPLANVMDHPGVFLTRWFFFLGIPLTAMLFLLKTRAARLYARALQTCYQRALLNDNDLLPIERTWLALQPQTRLLHPLSRWTWLALLPLCITWWPVIALLYVQQFVNNVGTWGWIDHPLLWLPWLGYSL